MQHYSLRNNAQASGGFTDLFILGTFRKFNATTKVWGSDFVGPADAFNTITTTVNVDATYNLIQMTETTPVVTGTQAAVPRFILGYPLAMIITKFPFLATAGTPFIDLGIAASLTASASIITGALSDAELQDKVTLPTAAVLPVAPTTVTQFLTATVNVAAAGGVAPSGLGSKATNPTDVGVDIWIYVCLLPYREWLQNRLA